MFENKTVIVFGGTGTIGSLIVEHLRDKECKTIRVFSNDENSLHEAKIKWGDDGMRYLLGDIRDYIRVLQGLKDVNYVFNCAAVKHVPIAETNPMEAIKTNILGLSNIIEALKWTKVSKLLHISTDKAVEPTTLMGASKMIGERLVQDYWEQNAHINMNVVRLGNIWESRGSLAGIIKDCNAKGEAIPITDRAMERFFMTQKDLLLFIIKTFKRMKGGEIHVPKLESYKIMDLVGDSPYRIIGIRKGEKIVEKLLSDYEELFVDDIYEDYWVIQ